MKRDETHAVYPLLDLPAPVPDELAVPNPRALWF